MKLDAVDAMRLGEHGHCGWRKRFELETPDARRCCEVAKQDPQLVRARQLVAPIGGEDEGAKLLDAAAEQAEDV